MGGACPVSSNQLKTLRRKIGRFCLQHAFRLQTATSALPGVSCPPAHPTCFTSHSHVSQFLKPACLSLSPCTNNTHTHTHPVTSVSLENPNTHVFQGLVAGRDRARSFWGSVVLPSLLLPHGRGQPSVLSFLLQKCAVPVQSVLLGRQVIREPGGASKSFPHHFTITFSSFDNGPNHSSKMDKIYHREGQTG